MFGWWRCRRELKTRVDADATAMIVEHGDSAYWVARSYTACCVVDVLVSLWRPDQQDAKPSRRPALPHPDRGGPCQGFANWCTSTQD
jgi:hypothetical protein